MMLEGVIDSCSLGAARSGLLTTFKSAVASAPTFAFALSTGPVCKVDVPCDVPTTLTK